MARQVRTWMRARHSLEWNTSIFDARLDICIFVKILHIIYIIRKCDGWGEMSAVLHEGPHPQYYVFHRPILEFGLDNFTILLDELVPFAVERVSIGSASIISWCRK